MISIVPIDKRLMLIAFNNDECFYINIATLISLYKDKDSDNYICISRFSHTEDKPKIYVDMKIVSNTLYVQYCPELDYPNPDTLKEIEIPLADSDLKVIETMLYIHKHKNRTQTVMDKYKDDIQAKRQIFSQTKKG